MLTSVTAVYAVKNVGRRKSNSRGYVPFSVDRLVWNERMGSGDIRE